MPITFGKAKEILAQYAGRGGLCPEDPEVDLFVKEVLQYLLYKGPNTALRTYCFQARQGCITFPYEIEAPIKVKIGDRAGDVWSMAFKYYDTPHLIGDCIPAHDALQEQSNHYPTVYDLPPGGSQVGVMGHCEESPDAYLIVKGYDPTNREIFTVHKGEKVSGEYLSIVKNQIRCTTATFGKISDIVTVKTNGYKTLFAVSSQTQYRQFLSDYSPLEEIPQYRRYKLSSKCADLTEVSVLARIRLKENYADSDVIPIDNIHTLRTAAQGIQLQANNDVQGAAAKDQVVDRRMTEENKYKKVGSGTPLDVHHATSPGRIQNIVSMFPFRRGRLP